MKFKFLAGAVSALALCSAPAAYAQAPGSITVNLPDGTTIVTTPQGLGYRIDISGGPLGTAQINIDSLSINGSIVSYSGTVTVSGSTTPVSCQIDTSAGTISGDSICTTAFATGSGGGGGGGGAPGGISGGITPPTTGGGTITTSTGPGGVTVYTLTYPNGTSAIITAGQASLIRNVEAEQFLLNLAADAQSIEHAHQLIVQRFSLMQAAGMAPGGINLSSAATYRGKSAGPGGMTPFFWVDAGASDLEDLRIGSGVKGDQQSVSIGADLSSETVTVGAFMSYGDQELSGPDASVETDGFTGGAYLRWALTPGVRLTGVFGAGGHDVSFSRTLGGLSSFGETERDSVFAVLGVEAQANLTNALVLVPSASVAWSKTETDAYTDSNGFPIGGVESDSTIGSVGGTAFFTGGSVTPFLNLSFNQHLEDQIGIDESWGTVGAGFVARLGRAAIVASVDTTVSKSDGEETSFHLTLRGGF